MLTQRFWVTEPEGQVRALQRSEFSIHQTLTLYERQLCSQRTGQRGKKGSIWLTTYKKTVIQTGNKENTWDPSIWLSHLKEAIQLRSLTEFPVTFPLISLVCKNEDHLTAQSLEKHIVSLEKHIITLSAEKRYWLPKEGISLNFFGSLSLNSYTILKIY